MVSEYVLKFSQPKYYRDPIVKYGYMRGTETVDYVYRIRQRWKQYSGVRQIEPGADVVSPSIPHRAKTKKKKYTLSMN